MNPIFDLKSEHDAMAIILLAMKKRADDIQYNRQVDLFRIAQIIDFLRTYNDFYHHLKEEKVLFPVLTEYGIPWISETIQNLVNEHVSARVYLNEIEEKMHDYLSGRIRSLEGISFSMKKYVALEENHMKVENEAILPLAEKYMDKKAQDTMYLNFKNIQNQHLGHLKHLEFYILLTKLYAETKVDYVSDF